MSHDTKTSAKERMMKTWRGLGAATLLCVTGASAQTISMSVQGSISSGQDALGASLALEGGILAMGAPHNTLTVTPFGERPGNVFAFDVAQCREVEAFGLGAYGGANGFGGAVALDGDLIAWTSTGGPGGAPPDSTSVWDLASNQPVLQMGSTVTGSRIALDGGILIVARDAVIGVMPTLDVRAFDVASGAELWSQTHNDQYAPVAIEGSRVVVGHSGFGIVGTVDVLDAQTGNLLGTLPTPAAASAGYGRDVDIDGDFALVAGSTVQQDGLVHAAAWVFDLTTLQEVQMLVPAGTPESSAASVSLDGGRAGIGVSQPNPDLLLGSTVIGSAAVFDIGNGSEILSVTNPDPMFSFTFGWDVVLEGDLLAVSAPGNYAFLGPPGVVYLFSVTGPVLPPMTYCQGKLSSAGCMPQIGATGTPSLTPGSTFDVTASGIVSRANGVLAYSTSGADVLPMSGGTLCLAPQIGRAGLANSGGNVPAFGDCSGSFGFELNAFLQSGGAPTLSPGDAIFLQWWYRDSPNSDGTGTGLSDAMKVIVGP